MGSHVEINHNCVILDCAPVTFGDHVFIGPNCGFYTAGHPLDAATRNAGGAGAVILPGVTIGAGSVIGGGSVVSRDIPPNSVAVGNPCRVVKEILREEPQREA